MASTCLIAEADPFIADLLLRFAEESGLLSARARTGQEILTLVQPIQPDVLIVDPEFPGELRGWEAVRMIRSGGASGSMAVISCSWLAKAEACELIGDVAWHLQKPDLYYTDFVKALAAAGVDAEGGG
jgi:CheY-like chemotaxis protein